MNQPITKEQIAQYVEIIAANINAIIMDYEQEPDPGAILMGIMEEIEKITDYKTPDIGERSFSKIMIWAILGIRSAMDANVRQRKLTPAAVIHPGEKLNNELEARKISLAEFAPKLGLTPGELFQVTQGQRDLDIIQIASIARALDMDLEIWAKAQANYLLGKLKKYNY